MIFLKSSALNDDVFGKSQYPIKKFLMDNEAAEANAHAIMEQIFDVMPVDDFATKFSGLTSRGNFQDVGENGTYPETEEQVGYSKVIEDTTWKSEFKVSKEMIEDAKMYDIRKRAAQFTRSYYRTRGQYAANILNNGASATMSFQSKTYNIACNDGLSLFNTAHTSITGGTGTQSNYFNAGFSYDNLCKVEELMNYFTDDNGMRIDVQPDTIIIPNKARIRRLIEDALNTNNGGRPGTADNSGNYQLGRWNIIVWDYLSNPTGVTSGYDVWYVMDSRYNKIDSTTLAFCDRLPLEVKSYVDDKTDANIWAGRARFAAAPVDWRGIAMCAAGLGSSIAD